MHYVMENWYRSQQRSHQWAFIELSRKRQYLSHSLTISRIVFAILRNGACQKGGKNDEAAMLFTRGLIGAEELAERVQAPNSMLFSTIDCPIYNVFLSANDNDFRNLGLYSGHPKLTTR